MLQKNWPKFVYHSAGLQVTYDVTKAKGSKVVDIKVTCTKCQVPRLVPIDLKEEYNLLCGSFLYNGGDGLTMFPGSIIRKEIIGRILFEIIHTPCDLFSGSDIFVE